MTLIKNNSFIVLDCNFGMYYNVKLVFNNSCVNLKAYQICVSPIIFYYSVFFFFQILLISVLNEMLNADIRNTFNTQ